MNHSESRIERVLQNFLDYLESNVCDIPAPTGSLLPSCPCTNRKRPRKRVKSTEKMHGTQLISPKLHSLEKIQAPAPVSSVRITSPMDQIQETKPNAVITIPPHRYARAQNTLPADVCFDDGDFAGGTNEDDTDLKWITQSSLKTETGRLIREPTTAVNDRVSSMSMRISKPRMMKLLRSTNNP